MIDDELFLTPLCGNLRSIFGTADLAALAESRGGFRSQPGRPQFGGGAPGSGGVSVIPVHGCIAKSASPLAEQLGFAAGADRIRDQVRAATVDPSVRSIVLDIDSPGGAIAGVPELVRSLSAARAVKPTFSVANASAGGTAYWLAAAAGETYCTPSGDVGAIGVTVIHQDISQAMANDGVKPTLISAGKYKVEGNPYQPLTADARAYLQSQVDDVFGTMTRSIALARNVPVATVRDGFGQGRSMRAGPALAAGAIDGVATLQDVIAMAQRDARGQPTQRALDAMKAQLTRNAQLRYQTKEKS